MQKSVRLCVRDERARVVGAMVVVVVCVCVCVGGGGGFYTQDEKVDDIMWGVHHHYHHLRALVVGTASYK
jgi:hypothetical protein